MASKSSSEPVSDRDIIAAAQYLDSAPMPQEKRILWDGEKFIYQKRKKEKNGR